MLRTIRVSLALVMVSCGGLVFTAGRTSAAPAASYRVTASGGIPGIERVGHALWANVYYRNIGSTIRTPILDLSGGTVHWVLDSLNSNLGRPVQKSAFGNYYRFRSLAHGRTMHVWTLLVPKDVGNHNFDLTLYPNWDSGTGIPTSTPLSALTASVAINP